LACVVSCTGTKTCYIELTMSDLLQGSYRSLTVVFQTFQGQNYFLFPDFSRHFTCSNHPQ